MTIYKFRVMYEDDDSIYRDVEIKPSQTIFDFESIIVSCYNLPPNLTGQFFLSNDNWHKVKQLQIAAQPEEPKTKSKGKSKTAAQAVPMLVAFIDDPHQKFIYEYKGNQEFVFLIELMTLTGNEKPSVIYPVCVRQQGPSPYKKEELVAHYSKNEDEGSREEHRVDDVEDDLDSMSKEGGDEEVITTDEGGEEEEIAGEDADDDEMEEAPEDADADEFGEEGFGGDFTDNDEKE